ncbi:hypothetical protein ACFL4P_02065, partial [Gemmatimonadota bacterium]
MITEIQTDQSLTPFGPEDITSLEQDILSHYPYPLSLSYKNILDTTDPLARLGVCMKDTLYTLLQYLALLMLHDYANSKMERSFAVFNSLELMVYRPGPGKWLGFLREVRKHYREQDSQPLIAGIFTFLDKHYHRKGTQLKLKDSSTTTRLPTLEALVALRNRWAHSKHLSPQEAATLCESVLLVIRHIYRDLAFLKDHPLLLSVSGAEPIPLAGQKLPELAAMEQEKVEVFLGDPDSNRPLLKLFLHVEIEKKKADLMLFEELIEQKHVLYSSSLNSHKFSRSDTRGQTVVESINGILER